MKLSDLSDDDISKVLSKTAAVVRQAAVPLRRAITAVSIDHNPSTNVDLGVSAFLKTALGKILDLPVLSEEDDFRYYSTGFDCWIVDPVDGTLNLLSGSPDVAISVALVNHNQAAQVAVVFLPMHEQLFSSQRGRGSYVNGSRLNAKPRTRTVAYGLQGDAQKDYLNLVEPIEACIAKGYILRQSGSAAIDICRVAQGTWSAFFQSHLFIWDIAAADLIATEAGAHSRLQLFNDSITCNYMVTAKDVDVEKFTKLIKWAPE